MAIVIYIENAFNKFVYYYIDNVFNDNINVHDNIRVYCSKLCVIIIDFVREKTNDSFNFFIRFHSMTIKFGACICAPARMYLPRLTIMSVSMYLTTKRIFNAILQPLNPVRMVIILCRSSCKSYYTFDFSIVEEDKMCIRIYHSRV